MSALLLRLTAEFKVDNKEVPFEDIVTYPPHLRELSAKLSRLGWLVMTWSEIQKELVRLHARWQKKKLTYTRETDLEDAMRYPVLWVEESEDEDDIFMPSEASKKAAAAAAAASSKVKGAASSMHKGEASSKGKGAASSKDKGATSSKGKSVASSKGKSDAGGCVDGR